MCAMAFFRQIIISNVESDGKAKKNLRDLEIKKSVTEHLRRSLCHYQNAGVEINNVF